MRPIHVFFRSYANFYGLTLLLTVLTLLIIIFWVSSSSVAALPEYSVRTGESCAACHVSAGGGGPRTLRGLIWAARGRPDQIPELPGILIAPRVTDAVELYQIACGGCHGYKAEGLSAMGLVNTNIRYAAMRSFTLRGIPGLGMPGFEGQFTDEQFETLVRYVTALSNGTLPPPSDTFELPPLLFRCTHDSSDPVCMDRSTETGGN